MRIQNQVSFYTDMLNMYVHDMKKTFEAENFHNFVGFTLIMYIGKHFTVLPNKCNLHVMKLVGKSVMVY